MKKAILLLLLLTCFYCFSQATDTLKVKETELDEIILSTKKKVLKVNHDKTTIVIDDSPFFQGANFYEAIAMAPEVMVSDSDIRILGKQNTLYLLNGREVRSSFVKNLKALQIESIEVISNPSAKYPAGYDSIINIKLKKWALQGWDTTIYTTSLINRLFSTTPGMTVNYNKDRFSLFTDVNFDIEEDVYTDNNYQEFQNYTENSLQKRFFSSRKNNLNTVFNYEIFDGQNLGVQFIGNTGKQDVKMYKYSQLNGFHSNAIRSHRTDFWKNNEASVSAYFQIEKEKLGFSSYLTLSQVKFRDDASIKDVNENDINIFYQNEHLYNKGNLWTFNTDAYFNVTEKSKLDVGLRYSYFDGKYATHIQGLINQQKLNNSFDFNEENASIFAYYAFPINKLNIATGLRMEHFKRDVLYNGRASLSDETLFFPSLSVSYKTGQHHFAWKFTSRIQRNSFNEITPYQYSTAFNNVFEGNPNLKNQRNYNAELRYIYQSKYYIFPYADWSKNKTGQYSIIKDDRIHYRFSNYDEIKIGVSTGFVNQKITNSLTAFHKMNFGYLQTRDISNVIDFKNDIFSWQSSTNLLYKTDFGNLNLFFNYTSPTYFGNYKAVENPYFNLTYSNSFIHKKLTLRLTFSDVFNTRSSKIENHVNGWRGISVQDRNWRGLTVFISYNFQKGRSKEVNTNVENDEINRF
ncbi:outer membrane beta-barrel protein [Bergeyella zoohelcum]|uniref:Outer membrane protein beta-barrel domain-containing protein n=1 Tax=Bergeyella zoohelcum TaxID=1015 RepID=A0A7Z8YNY3_9FLAO|nr:outer membrane beta-barrel protein [Bergeyella zoohelcum]VDH04733.1 Uncharacterised protein [Bergeyella zoohelcum]